MSEYIERIAFAIFSYRYPESQEFWPDRLDELVSGPPFDADGYRGMARAAIAAMEQPSQKMIDAGEALDDEGSPNDGDFGRVASADEHWRAMITAELKSD